MEAKTYTLAEAARLAEASEDELRQAIRDHMLAAKFLHNTGDYLIDAEELRRYMKRTRGTDVIAKRRKRKVLVIDDDPRFGETVRLELGRDPRVEVKYVSWGKDGLMVARNYAPDLCILELVPPSPQSDEIIAAINKHRESGKVGLVVTSPVPPELVLQKPELDARLKGLHADAFVPKAGGTRPLIVAAFRHLGVETTTVILKRQA
jgi:response regulator RpfG family c-di-GMP phosphodiesterase